MIAGILAGIVITPPHVSAQPNLIPNGNFEQHNGLAYLATHNPCYNGAFPSFWSSPTLGTPDMINEGAVACDYFYNNTGCGCYPQVCEFDNLYGCQAMMPATAPYAAGSVYMGIMTASTSTFFQNSVDFREYLKCTLNISGGLIAGQCYRLSYWVSQADLSVRATTVQAVITDQDFTNMNSFAGVIDASSCPLWFQPRHPVKNKLGWVELVYDFVAEGGETLLYLGFFEDENSLDIDDDLTGVQEGCTSTSCTSNSAYTSPNNQISYYYIDNVSLFATAGPSFTPDYTFNSSNPTISGNYNNAEILISGDVTISGTVTFQQCTLKCNDGSTITVPNGQSMRLWDNTTLEAGCQNMWDGIILNGGTLDMKGSRISDAWVAVTVNSSLSHWYIYRDGFNRLCTFSRNVQDFVANGATSGTNYVRATIFDHATPLNDPTAGNAGFGTNCMVFNGSVYPGNIETIGSTIPSDGCLFLGGQSAIISKDQNLVLNNCIFSGQSSTAVDFQGTLTPSSLTRSLTVLNSTFIQGKSHIKSYFKTNLTVEASSFSNAAEHSVMWFYNPDCHLKIGDDDDPNKGNVFNNNGWTAVITMGNTTGEHIYGFLSDPNNTMYSTLVISNNKVNGPPWATGIFVTEPALGSHVSYQRLSISRNVMNGLNEGILLSNVRGWGGIFSTPPANLPETWINGNQILVSTVITATSTCIKLANAPGLNVSQNGLDSDNRQDWQNTGIRIDYSENTEVAENIVGAGRGIIAGGIMISSNIHCNTLVGNEVGIVVGWCALRPDATYLHGSSIEAYANNFILSPPIHTDIHEYYSPIEKNQWVWTNSVTPTYPNVYYEGVTGGANQSSITTSIISFVEGPFLCSGDPYRIAYGAGPNVGATFSDPDLQWRYDYNYQVVKNNTNSGSSNYSSANIKRIIRIEDAINSGDYNLAAGQLNGLNPANTIEQNYKTVLEIMLNVNSPMKRDLNATEIATLTQIAEQNIRTAGAAVALARGILRFQQNLKFKDEEFVTDERVKGTAFIQTPCCLAPASGTQLTFVDQLGNYLPISPAFVEQNGEFTFDPYQLSYYSAANPGTLFRIASAPGSKFTVLNRDFKTLADWISSSPLEIILGGAKEDYVLTSMNQNTNLISSTNVTDADGNSYSVGTVNSNSGSDFLIEKRNPSGNILWSKNYHGHAAGNDSATCLALGADGNIYVAGKVWNGNHYNFATVKYDTTGFLQWDVVLEDTVYSESPTAIAFYPGDTSVIVTGSCTNSNQAHFKTVKYKQCVTGPNSMRLLHEASQEVVLPENVNYYPNPNKGSISIDTKGAGCSLVLYNVNGQIVWNKGNLSDGTVEFPENQVPDGVYLCKFIMLDGQTQFEKLIIQRN